jgi:adenosylhomocysteine nucleosidase
LAEEQQGLLELMNHPERVLRAGREFWRGELHGQSVVLALSRMGKVAAATTATALIESFGVHQIIFTGVAGGLGAGVRVGDVVVASAFVQHDLDVSPLFPRYQVPLYATDRFACDPHLTQRLLSACQSMVSGSALGADLPARDAQVHQGLIATGDAFIGAADQARLIQQDLARAGLLPLAVEMEGAAVAQVCFDYGIAFAAMRTISDRADDQAHVDFAKFVSEVASRYALVIVSEFLQKLGEK